MGYNRHMSNNIRNLEKRFCGKTNYSENDIDDMEEELGLYQARKLNDKRKANETDL